MNTQAPILIIRAVDPHDLNAQLDAAESELKQEAMQGCDRGILVKRLSPEEFVLALDSSIPFGLTVEQSVW